MSRPGIKNISLNAPGKSALLVRPSHPKRGALRTSRHARWDAVDAEPANDERKVSRTAKACGSGTAALVSSSREAELPGGDGGKKAVRREEHVISRKPLRREGRVFSAGPVCSCAFSFVQFCTRDRGCSAHPVFPAPSSLHGGENSSRPRALRAARMRSLVIWLAENWFMAQEGL